MAWGGGGGRGVGLNEPIFKKSAHYSDLSRYMYTGSVFSVPRKKGIFAEPKERRFSDQDAGS